MRVISRDPHHSVVKQIICKNCGVTLEYVPADVKSKTISDYTGCNETVKFIKCPECNNTITVS